MRDVASHVIGDELEVGDVVDGQLHAGDVVGDELEVSDVHSSP